MWTANAATVSPSADTADGRVHFTPANLVTHFHRALEAPVTARVLRAIFADARHFEVHDPLPAAPQLGDEGAANHTRFGGAAAGTALFVYGRSGVRRRRPRAGAFSGAANARGLRGRSPAATGSTLRARYLRSRIRTSSTAVCSTTM